MTAMDAPLNLDAGSRQGKSGGEGVEPPVRDLALQHFEKLSGPIEDGLGAVSGIMHYSVECQRYD
jgi:hypothetical protein